MYLLHEWQSTITDKYTPSYMNANYEGIIESDFQVEVGTGIVNIIKRHPHSTLLVNFISLRPCRALEPWATHNPTHPLMSLLACLSGVAA